MEAVEIQTPQRTGGNALVDLDPQIVSAEEETEITEKNWELIEKERGTTGDEERAEVDIPSTSQIISIPETAKEEILTAEQLLEQMELKTTELIYEKLPEVLLYPTLFEKVKRFICWKRFRGSRLVSIKLLVGKYGWNSWIEEEMWTLSWCSIKEIKSAANEMYLKQVVQDKIWILDPNFLEPMGVVVERNKRKRKIRKESVKYQQAFIKHFLKKREQRRNEIKEEKKEERRKEARNWRRKKMMMMKGIMELNEMVMQMMGMMIVVEITLLQLPLLKKGSIH